MNCRTGKLSVTCSVGRSDICSLSFVRLSVLAFGFCHYSYYYYHKQQTSLEHWRPMLANASQSPSSYFRLTVVHHFCRFIAPRHHHHLQQVHHHHPLSVDAGTEYLTRHCLTEQSSAFIYCLNRHYSR